MFSVCISNPNRIWTGDVFLFSKYTALKFNFFIKSVDDLISILTIIQITYVRKVSNNFVKYYTAFEICFESRYG